MEASHHLFAEESYFKSVCLFPLLSFSGVSEPGEEEIECLNFQGFAEIPHQEPQGKKNTLSCRGMRKFPSWISDCLAGGKPSGQVSQHHRSPQGFALITLLLSSDNGSAKERRKGLGYGLGWLCLQRAAGSRENTEQLQRVPAMLVAGQRKGKGSLGGVR